MAPQIASNDAASQNRATRLREGCHRAARLLILLLLIFTVLAATGENLHARMLQWGTALWADYVVLRSDEPPPSCDPDFDLETRLRELEAELDAEADDLFAETFDRQSAAESLENQRAVCQSSHDAYRLGQERVDGFVILYRGFEHALAALSLFAISQQHLVLMLVLLVALTIATLRQHHIAFRNIVTPLDHRISLSVQALAAVTLLVSALAFYRGGLASGVAQHRPELVILLAAGAFLQGVICLWQLVARKPAIPASVSGESRVAGVGMGQSEGEAVASGETGGSFLHALLAVPIYSYMLLGASLHFMVFESHPAGVAIYFTQLFQMSGLYLNIALYIWVGMLLKETLLGTRMFAVFTPWRLPPEILAFVVIALLAVPTAYTGASGIIIIAMGATVYQELRRIGTRRQLALAVTAMTGSSGVVLRPCLLIVGIAMLNKEVVTDELYSWGVWVFLLSLAVFLVFALLVRTQPLIGPGGAPPWRDSLRGLAGLLPYVLLTAVVALFYAGVLDAHLDEFSAPLILPVLVLAFLLHEHGALPGNGLWRRAVTTPDVSTPDVSTRESNLASTPDSSLRGALSASVAGASVQIGALLMLMGCSFAVGGMLEQSAGGELVVDFTSPALAMCWLLLFLVIIGMLMDPFGALILVSGTLAPVAYANGIAPVHFWMTCLVAFELGYLTPPVALNHLLTRQVVGAQELALASVEGGSFYYRHERLLLPLMVMSTTLLIVAFQPLL